jgi:hypothetical protein
MGDLDEIIKLAGGPNFDPYKKPREKAEKWLKSNDVGISPFLIEKASAKHAPKRKIEPLFGELWRTGEVAVLIGEPGVGKSLLATQIAEVIARGAKHSINGLPTASKPRRVIYFDFERTPEQFAGLYSCQPFPATPYREDYKFSRRFQHARLDLFTDIPGAFNGSLDRYIRYWVVEAIAERRADVFVIDGIAHLAGGTSIEKVMRRLRPIVAGSGASLLIVAPAKPKRRPSPVTLADLTRCRSLREMPDSVFAIARSITHPDIRYVKDLKSRTSQLTADLPALMSEPQASATNPSAVLTYRIERLQTPVWNDDRALNTNHSSLSTPFLGLNYLGLSLESHHLPAPRVSSPHVSKGSFGRQSSREALLNGMTDGSYRRYLLGK